MSRFHQRGDVLPPPCSQIPRAAGGELGRVQRSICRGVKIVVEVDAVHSVVLHQLCNALHHIVCGFRDSRVQVQPLAHGADPLGMYIGKVIFRQRGRHLRRGAEAVGVHPRFQRKAPAVCFGDEDVQRVEAGVLPLYAGAEMAPREEGAPVKRVPERPHLRDDGVQSDGQTVVHQRRRTGTEGCFGGKVHPGPFQIAHPDGPPFTRGQGGVWLCFVRRRHRRRRGRLAPAQQHRCPGHQQEEQVERFGGTHQLQLALDGHAALILGAEQQRPGQRRAEVARPAVDHVAHHQQHEHAGEVAFFPACRAFFRREEKGRDSRRGECDLLDEAEAGAAQDGKAVEHGGRCGSQQQEIPGLSREFEFHIVPPARRKGAGSPSVFGIFQIL